MVLATSGCLLRRFFQATIKYRSMATETVSMLLKLQTRLNQYPTTLASCDTSAGWVTLMLYYVDQMRVRV